MSIYKAIASPSDGRQITFTCSIHLITEAMGPGNHIFDKTEEIPVFLGPGEAVQKKRYTIDLFRNYIHDITGFPSTSSVTAPTCEHRAVEAHIGQN